MKIKPLVKDFIKPEYKNNMSGGLDLYIQEDITLRVGVDNVIKLGFAAEVPEGHVALLVPRSSTGIKGLYLQNTVGVIDADYRGEWIAHVVIDEINSFGKNDTPAIWGNTITLKKGERALQTLIVPVKRESIDIVDELSVTDRGDGGFGSTGK